MSLEAAPEGEPLAILKPLERPAGKSSHQHPPGAHSTPSSPRIDFAPLLPPLNSRTSSPSRSPIHSLIAAAQDSPPDRSLTDTTGAPCSAGHLAWSNSNGTSYWNSMSSLHGTPKLLRDRDKPGNLTPNGAHNFAIRPSVPPPAPKRATQASWNDPAPPSSYDTGVAPAGGGLSHQFQRPYYITSRDLHPRNPLLGDGLSSPACWQPDFQPNNQRCRHPNWFGTAGAVSS